jgi:hypothetical protein
VWLEVNNPKDQVWPSGLGRDVVWSHFFFLIVLRNQAPGGYIGDRDWEIKV